MRRPFVAMLCPLVGVRCLFLAIRRMSVGHRCPQRATEVVAVVSFPFYLIPKNWPRPYADPMQAIGAEEEEFFAALARSGARALLIGRQAMIVLGVPVMTSDYDLWTHIDDIERLNAAVEPLGLVPNRTGAEARLRGRYVLENDLHVDVMVARAATTKDTAEKVGFDDVWARRQSLAHAPGVDVAVPALDDLIRTKRWALRQKDVSDIQLLEALRRTKAEGR